MPTAFPLLYRVDAAQFTNRVETLRNVVPALAGPLTDLLACQPTPETVRTLLDAYFTKHLKNVDPNPDRRLGNAVATILAGVGTLNVLTELDAALSHRLLSRLFQFYIGDTPEVFSRIVRFQQSLGTQPSVQVLRHDKGFYDQAHFIKEFKTLYGQIPGSLGG